MLVLITNSRVPYCFDVAHVLGMPRNLSHRFRYRKRWIAVDSSLSKRRALVVLRNFDSGEFIPLRFARINDVLAIGDMVYLDFGLLGFPQKDATSDIATSISRAIEVDGNANTGGTHLGALVVDIPEIDALCKESTARSDDVLRWHQILAQIGNIECYKEYGFLRVLQLSDAGGRTARVARDGSGRYAYALSPGTLYYLDVVQYVPWQVEDTEEMRAPYDVELVAESDEIILLRKVQRVVGKYDLLRFIFKTPHGYGAKHTFLEITDKQGVPGAQFRLPTLFLPVHVQPTRKMRAIVWARRTAQAVSIGTFIASGALAGKIHWDPELVRTMSLLVLVMASQRWEEAVKAFVDKSKDATLRS